jgi:hypothetical protein
LRHGDTENTEVFFVFSPEASASPWYFLFWKSPKKLVALALLKKRCPASVEGAEERKQRLKISVYPVGSELKTRFQNHIESTST